MKVSVERVISVLLLPFTASYASSSSSRSSSESLSNSLDTAPYYYFIASLCCYILSLLPGTDYTLST
jgi:hypothetical protein